MEKSWKKGMKQDILSSIKSLMETMSWTLDQAMTALKVPEAEKQTYRSRLSSERSRSVSISNGQIRS